MPKHKSPSTTNANSEIIPAGDGSIHLTALGAQFKGDVSEEAVDELLQKSGRLARGCMFIIGDAINYANGKWGEKYDRWIELTGLEYQTLRNSASIAGKIDLYRRRYNLTFEHHKLVAPLDPEAQTSWLDLTEKHHMSKRRLRKSIIMGRVLGLDEMELDPADRGKMTYMAYILRFRQWWRMRTENDPVEQWDDELRGMLKRDMQPIVDIYNQL